MPRARCQYVSEMRDRFEIGLTPVDRHRATDEEKASLTEAQVSFAIFQFYLICQNYNQMALFMQSFSALWEMAFFWAILQNKSQPWPVFIQIIFVGAFFMDLCVSNKRKKPLQLES
jgi:hypothetical protein